MSITYSKTFVDSASDPLTAAQLETMKAEIRTDANAKDGADLNAGSVTTTKLASPNAYYTITVPCIRSTDSLASTVLATAQPGVAGSLTGVDFPCRVAVASTLIAITASCRTATSAGGTRNNDARLVQNGTALAATIAEFPDSGGSNTTSSLAIALVATDTLLIRVQTDTGANDGVAGGFVILHLKAVHQT